MKSIKAVLLGFALLIIASCGLPLLIAGAGVGAGMFYVGGIICLDGKFVLCKIAIWMISFFYIYTNQIYNSFGEFRTIKEWFFKH